MIKLKYNQTKIHLQNTWNLRQSFYSTALNLQVREKRCIKVKYHVRHNATNGKGTRIFQWRTDNQKKQINK